MVGGRQLGSKNIVLIGSPKMASGQSGSSGFDPQTYEAWLCLLESHFDVKFELKCKKDAVFCGYNCSLPCSFSPFG